MLYIFIVCILSFTANLISGPTCSRPKVHDSYTSSAINEDQTSSKATTNPQIAPKLYFSVTIQEVNKEEYDTQIEKCVQNPNAICQPFKPLATFSAIYISTKNSRNKQFHALTQMTAIGDIQLIQEEKLFIDRIITTTPSPSNLIHCRPIIEYTYQPKNRVRYMILTCPHDLNPNFQASNS